jgi:rhamnosyltransferase
VTDLLVSILILTRNGMATLPATLDRIASQKRDFPLEVVAVDSGSTDGTAELLARRVDRVIPIAPASFNHGATRNLGIGHCKGDLVVLLVQDALPDADDWLAALIHPLREDDGMAGAYARQIPRPEADAVTRYYLAGYQACSMASRTASVAGPEEFVGLSAVDQLSLCTFDNVCSCVRRSVWQAHPFPTANIAEDVEWAQAVLLAGHRLGYVASAAVVHSHHRSARYELDRTYLIHQRLHALFGLTNIPTTRHLARAILTSFAAHFRCMRADRARGAPSLAEWWRAAALAVAFPLGQYLGARASRTGRTLLRTGRV